MSLNQKIVVGGNIPVVSKMNPPREDGYPKITEIVSDRSRVNVKDEAFSKPYSELSKNY